MPSNNSTCSPTRQLFKAACIQLQNLLLPSLLKERSLSDPALRSTGMVQQNAIQGLRCRSECMCNAFIGIFSSSVWATGKRLRSVVRNRQSLFLALMWVYVSHLPALDADSDPFEFHRRTHRKKCGHCGDPQTCFLLFHLPAYYHRHQSCFLEKILPSQVPELALQEVNFIWI